MIDRVAVSLAISASVAYFFLIFVSGKVLSRSRLLLPFRVELEKNTYKTKVNLLYQ